MPPGPCHARTRKPHPPMSCQRPGRGYGFRCLRLGCTGRSTATLHGVSDGRARCVSDGWRARAQRPVRLWTRTAAHRRAARRGLSPPGRWKRLAGSSARTISSHLPEKPPRETRRQRPCHVNRGRACGGCGGATRRARKARGGGCASDTACKRIANALLMAEHGGQERRAARDQTYARSPPASARPVVQRVARARRSNGRRELHRRYDAARLPQRSPATVFHCSSTLRICPSAAADGRPRPDRPRLRRLR
jgi:hypothetical protein